MSEYSDTDQMVFEIAGRVGRMRLNRPKAIHALTHPMCGAMAERLLAWREDPAIEAVMIDHMGPRGFCAGGDVRALAESGAKDGEEARRFFFCEYRLNYLLFTYAKPTVAFMDGITMGGGVGISQPCKHIVVTERTIYAMPETTIGLFPDVGGGWYLSRMPGRTGHFLALTGARIDGADCMATGLATHYIPSVALDDVKAEIVADPQEIKAILDAAAVSPPPSSIQTNQPLIDRLFASDDYEEVLHTLEADGSGFAREQLDRLSTKSPQSCKVSLRLLKEAAKLTDFGDEMRMEYGVAGHIVQRHDFIEGVRALLVDKDNEPRWNPAKPESVTLHMIDTIFAPLPERERWTPY